MSVQIKGVGTIGGIDQGLNIVGVTTASNFKTGTSNVHSTGYECTNVNASGIITASSYRGDGSQLTGITGTTINSNADNRIITGSGTANTLQGESGLTYDGTTLSNDAVTRNIQAGYNYLLVGSSDANGASIALDGDSNGDGTGVDYAFIEHDTSGDLNIVADNPANASNIIFKTNSTTERLRIASDGNVHINCPDNGTANAKLNIEDSTNNSTNTLKLINKPSGVNGKARLEFYTETTAGQGCSPYIMSTSGTDAFGSNNANDGGFEFHTKYSGSGTDATAMKISNKGYVLKPTTPSFSTNAQSTGFSANSPNYLTPSARINNGNCYNASNGRFTAPIDGTYFFFFSYVGDNGVAAPVMYFAVNQSDSGPGSSCYYTAYQGAYHGQIYTLSEGDFVNASAKDWNGATPDPWNTYWGGWLIY